jgi:hypothetical protein
MSQYETRTKHNQSINQRKAKPATKPNKQTKPMPNRDRSACGKSSSSRSTTSKGG